MRSYEAGEHHVAGPLYRGRRNGGEAVAEGAAPLRIIEESPAFWRNVFDIRLFNIVDAHVVSSMEGRLLAARMDASPSLRVVVFEMPRIQSSSSPHFDLTGNTGNITPRSTCRLADPDRHVRRINQISGGQHSQDSRGCVRGFTQRIRARLRYAVFRRRRDGRCRTPV